MRNATPSPQQNQKGGAMQRHQVLIQFLALLALMSASACGQPEYASLVGEWTTHHEEYGEMDLFIFEDNTLVLWEDEDEFHFPITFYSASDSIVQISYGPVHREVRYQPRGENTTAWMPFGGETVLEIQPVSQNELRLASVQVRGLEPDGTIILRDADHPKNITIAFTRKEEPLSDAYRSFAEGKYPDIPLMGKWIYASTEESYPRGIESPATWKSVDFLREYKAEVTYMRSADVTVFEYLMPSDDGLLLVSELGLQMYGYQIRGNSLGLKHGGSWTRFVRAN